MAYSRPASRLAKYRSRDVTCSGKAMLHEIKDANVGSAVVSPAARVGIGGPVGSGKTALIEALIPELQRRGVDLAVVTTDLVTGEDAERLRRSGLIDPARGSAVEAGACPHTVIREDPTLNIAAGDDLEARFPGVELILFESGGDNLASTFSLDLVDWWMFVIDVAGGDDIPRKKGPGLLRCDLLVVNKIDLAPYVGVELAPMLAEAARVRAGRPVIATNARSGVGIEADVRAILSPVLFKGFSPPPGGGSVFGASSPPPDTPVAPPH